MADTGLHEPPPPPSLPLKNMMCVCFLAEPEGIVVGGGGGWLTADDAGQ